VRSRDFEETIEMRLDIIREFANKATELIRGGGSTI
jgi:hypothetical protein